MPRPPAGDLRTLAAEGGRLLGGNGHPEAGWQFSSGDAWSLFSITAAQYNNTRMHSQSNSGHELSDVLTDGERMALIEYLKTL